MKKSTLLCCFLLSGFVLLAQDDKASRPSPPAQATATVNGKTITIDYSQPSVKGRKIWGDLVPYGKVWRADPNETTAFTLSADAMIEGKKLPAGKYAFFVIPNEKEWTIIFNKSIWFTTMNVPLSKITATPNWIVVRAWRKTLEPFPKANFPFNTAAG